MMIIKKTELSDQEKIVIFAALILADIQDADAHWRGHITPRLDGLQPSSPIFPRRACQHVLQLAKRMNLPSIEWTGEDYQFKLEGVKCE